jgi:competence ComEA-like helix-hairpin-helix protein
MIVESDRREADVSEHEGQVERDEEQAIGEDEPKEAMLEAIEEGYRSTPRSESIEEQMLASEEGDEGRGDQAGEEPAETGQWLDLNTATEKELSSLHGIGPALAKRIVRYREEEGPFREAAEITNVQGISQVTYQALADQIGASSVEVIEAEQAELLEPEEAEEAVEEAGEAAEGGEEMAEDEGEAAVAPPAPPAPSQRVAQAPPAARRGAGWGSLLTVGLLSTLAGALLALLVLFLLNGGVLDFERATARAIDREASQLDGQLSELRTQLDEVRQRLGQFEELSRQLDEMQSALEGTQAEVGSVQEQVGSLQSALDVTSQGLADVRQTLAGLSDDLTSVAEDVTALEDQVDAMDEQVVALRRTAARFDQFLLGLQQLLDETALGAESPQTREATPTRTPWITPTPTATEASATPSSEVTVIPLATPTP